MPISAYGAVEWSLLNIQRLNTFRLTGLYSYPRLHLQANLESMGATIPNLLRHIEKPEFYNSLKRRTTLDEDASVKIIHRVTWQLLK